MLIQIKMEFQTPRIQTGTVTAFLIGTMQRQTVTRISLAVPVGTVLVAMVMAMVMVMVKGMRRRIRISLGRLMFISVIYMNLWIIRSMMFLLSI